MRMDAIVPCYNEEERIGAVLQILSKSPYIRRIIVADDGSTDKSAEVASKFRKTKVIRLSKNVGKGVAIKTALKSVNAEVIFLCDADLEGLTPEHIKDFAVAFEENPNNLIVGFRNKGDSKILYWIRKNLTLDMEGERVLLKKDLEKVLLSENSKGFGLEAWMNYYFKKNNRKTTTVRLDGVYNPLMIKKRKNGAVLYLKEIYTDFKTYFYIYQDKFQTE